MGFVQSGKTTNFTAVMAKAADRGYKLFIVLSGIHNDLRRQTQIRLIAGPGGSQSDTMAPGDERAGTTSSRRRTRRPSSPPRNRSVLLVVKKNAAGAPEAARLVGTAGEYLEKCPALIIDDEADQSTVATAEDQSAAPEVLDKFPAVGLCRLHGDTVRQPADRSERRNETLYPRDFIVNLPQPGGTTAPRCCSVETRSTARTRRTCRAVTTWSVPCLTTRSSDLKSASKKDAMGFQPAMTHVTPASRRVVLAGDRGTPCPWRRQSALDHADPHDDETAVHEAFREPILDARALDPPGHRRRRRLDQRLRATWEHRDWPACPPRISARRRSASTNSCPPGPRRSENRRS